MTDRTGGVLFKKFLGALLQGIGIALGIVLIAYTASILLTGKAVEAVVSEAEKAAEETSGFTRFGPESGLRIARHEARAIKNGVEILAEVENGGGHNWLGVTVEVELYAKDKFIDECSGYVRGKLAPGQKENVKVKCGGCDTNPLPRYDRYTIVVKDATSF